MQNKHYKKEKIEMKSNDEEVSLRVRTNSVFNAESIEEKEELSEKEAKELYFGRWEIEKSFDIIKNKIKIENFTLHKVIGVEQDFYSQMLLYNMLEDVRIDTGEIVKGQEEGLKYDYKVNMNVMVGTLRERFMEIILSNKEDLQKKADEFNEEIKKYLVPIKPGRSYPRKRMHSMNKYRHNLRENC